MISHPSQPSTATRPRTPWTGSELDIGPVPTATDPGPAAVTGDPRRETPVQTCGGTVVRVEEVLDRAGLSRLQERCRAETAAGATTIVIDFETMGSCCSATFVALQQINTILRGGGTQLRLVGLEAALLRAVGVD